MLVPECPGAGRVISETGPCHKDIYYGYQFQDIETTGWEVTLFSLPARSLTSACTTQLKENLA